MHDLVHRHESQGKEVDEIKRKDSNIIGQLRKECSDPSTVGCAVRAAESLGQCEALAKSLPFAP